MKIDKEELKRLAQKSDAELWAAICAIAASHGFKLPEKTPEKAEMEKIRTALLGAEKLNIMDAAKLIREYRKKG